MEFLPPLVLRRSAFRALALTLLLFTVLIDNMNAVTQRYMGLPGFPFQVLKMSVALLCLLALDRARLRLALVLMGVVMAFPVVHLFLHEASSGSWYYTNFAFFQKIAVFPIYCLFMEKEVRERGVRYPAAIAISAYLLVAANLVLSAFGFGFSQYDAGQGTLGFFISGNEVTGLQLVASTIFLAYSWERWPKWYILIALVVVMLGALKGTKSGIGGSVVFAALVPLLMRRDWKRVNIKAMFATVLLVPPVLAAGGYGVWWALIKFEVLGRWSYFLAKLGLVSMLFSTRDQRVGPFLVEFNDDWTWVQKLLGKGVPDETTRIFIEIDSLDILQSAGLVGTILILGFWFLLILSIASRMAVSRPLANVSMASFVFSALFLANTAGHVMYAGMVLPYLGVVYGLSFASGSFRTTTKR